MTTSTRYDVSRAIPGGAFRLRDVLAADVPAGLDDLLSVYEPATTSDIEVVPLRTIALRMAEFSARVSFRASERSAWPRQNTSMLRCAYGVETTDRGSEQQRSNSVSTTERSLAERHSTGVRGHSGKGRYAMGSVAR